MKLEFWSPTERYRTGAPLCNSPRTSALCLLLKPSESSWKSLARLAITFTFSVAIHQWFFRFFLRRRIVIFQKQLMIDEQRRNPNNSHKKWDFTYIYIYDIYIYMKKVCLKIVSPDCQRQHLWTPAPRQPFPMFRQGSSRNMKWWMMGLLKNGIEWTY